MPLLHVRSAARCKPADKLFDIPEPNRGPPPAVLTLHTELVEQLDQKIPLWKIILKPNVVADSIDVLCSRYAVMSKTINYDDCQPIDAAALADDMARFSDPLPRCTRADPDRYQETQCVESWLDFPDEVWDSDTDPVVDRPDVWYEMSDETCVPADETPAPYGRIPSEITVYERCWFIYPSETVPGLKEQFEWMANRGNPEANFPTPAS